MPRLFAFSLVFLGGGLGSMFRYGLYLLLRPLLQQFPWATFAANGLACLVLGFALGHTDWPEQRRLLLTTGFCGGFSTFSTFTAESWGLWQAGQHAAFVGNVFGSLALCFLCLLLGLKLAA
ncbi:MAG: fluoride efflux transporter CrcB [Saprospiraceae bacterium]